VLVGINDAACFAASQGLFGSIGAERAVVIGFACTAECREFEEADFAGLVFSSKYCFFNITQGSIYGANGIPAQKEVMRGKGKRNNKITINTCNNNDTTFIVTEIDPFRNLSTKESTNKSNSYEE
jgi:hypothetical protein